MKKLENFLFGSLDSPVEFGKEDDEELRDGVEKSSALFFTDKATNSVLSVYEDDAEFRESSDDEDEAGQRKPVWVDDEEEKDESVISGSAYVSRLRAHHVKLNPGAEWAQLDSLPRNYSSDDEDSGIENGVVLARGCKDVEGVDDILRTNEDLVVKSSVKLLPGLLEYSRLVDANSDDLSNAPINSVQFHRNSQLLLTAGLDNKLRFFQIDGKRNTKIQRIFLDDCPIQKACFLPDGSQVIASGTIVSIYLEVFEVLPDSNTIAFVGNEGYILLVSSKTTELIGTLKMNGTSRSLVVVGNEGYI
ncbi:unnamed protein product [Camellia sinensis]